MNFRIFTCFLLLLIGSQLDAQQATKEFSFKQGEVLDVILLTSVPQSSALFDRYKKTAFPVAFEYGYQPQPGFKFAKLTLGTLKTDSFLFGKWESKAKRSGFLANITTRVPDFHQQRRALFDYFGLAYFEMKSDVSFSIQKEKHNVVTSFWQEDSVQLATFLAEWKAQAKQSGGEIVLELENGESPIGYYYNPNVLLIVAWDDEAAFQNFADSHKLSTYGPVKNVHQFVID